MPELDIPQPGETIAAGTFGQPVVYRVISRYDSAAARDAANPAPSAGDPSYRKDTNVLELYDGATWVPQHAGAVSVSLSEYAQDRLSPVTGQGNYRAKVSLWGDMVTWAGIVYGAIEDWTVPSTDTGLAGLMPTDGNELSLALTPFNTAGNLVSEVLNVRFQASGAIFVGKVPTGWDIGDIASGLNGWSARAAVSWLKSGGGSPPPTSLSP